MVILDKKARHLPVKVPHIGTAIPTIPMESGELRRARIHVATRAQFVIIHDVPKMNEERRIPGQHLVVNLQTGRAFVAGLPALAGRDHKIDGITRVGFRGRSEGTRQLLPWGAIDHATL